MTTTTAIRVEHDRSPSDSESVASHKIQGDDRTEAPPARPRRLFDNESNDDDDDDCLQGDAVTARTRTRLCDSERSDANDWNKAT